jgi:hypothetical protein
MGQYMRRRALYVEAQCDAGGDHAHQGRLEVMLVPFEILWQIPDIMLGTIGNLPELE